MVVNFLSPCDKFNQIMEPALLTTSTSTQALLLCAFGTTVLIALFLGGRGRRGTSSIVSFFWGDSDLKSSEGAHLNISTGFSLNGVLYSAWLGYRGGVSSIAFQTVWCLSYLFLARYASRFSELSRTGTLHGIIGHRYGKLAAMAAAISSIIGFTMLLGWELLVGVSVFQAVIPNYDSLQPIIYLSLAGIAAVYSMLGGIRGNLISNRVLNYMGALGLMVAFLYLLHPAVKTAPITLGDFFDLSSFSRLLTELTLTGLFVNIIFSVAYQFVDMSIWENIASLKKDGKETTRSLYLAAFWVYILPIGVGSLFGMLLRSFETGITSNNILAHLVSMLAGNPLVFVVVIMGFFALMLSTVDGFLLASAQALVWDIIHKRDVQCILRKRGYAITSERSKTSIGVEPFDTDLFAQRPSTELDLEERERTILLHAKCCIMLIALLGSGTILYIVKTFSVDIFSLVYIAYAGQMCLFPVVLTILRGDNTERPLGALGMLLGLFGGSAFAIYGLVTSSSAIILTPAVALVLSCILWLPAPGWLQRAAKRMLA